MSRMLMIHRPMRTGAWWEYLIPGWNVYAGIRDISVATLAHDPALSDEESAALRQQLLDARARQLIDLCTPHLPTYDAAACAAAQGAQPVQTREEIDAEHYSRDTTGGERCGTLDLPCLAGVRNPDGSWRSPANWPMPAKVVGAVALVAAAGFTVGLVRGIAGLFKR